METPPLIQYAGLDAFLQASDYPSGHHRCTMNGMHYDLLIKRRAGTHTIFMFHGANKRERPLPYFIGLGVTGSLDADIIYVSDPSLQQSDTLRIGWYAGGGHPPVQQTLVPMIRAILDCTGRPALFFGASGGGFAALYYSWFVPESWCLPINPQSILHNYSARIYQAFLLACHDGRDKGQEIVSQATFDLRKLYQGGYKNRILYLQNASDHHVGQHMLPFLNGLPTFENIRVLMGNWGVGHHVAPKELIVRLLEQALVGSLANEGEPAIDVLRRLDSEPAA